MQEDFILIIILINLILNKKLKDHLFQMIIIVV